MKARNLTLIFLISVSIVCFVIPLISQLSLDLTIVCIVAGVNSLNIGLIENTLTRRTIAISSFALLIYPLFHLMIKLLR